MTIQAGTLWKNILRVTDKAIETGALQRIGTEHAFIEDGGMRFLVRMVTGLRRKDEARREQTKKSQPGKEVDPFLPPEQDLLVGDISDTHIAVLNKFNVVEHHLLIVTRAFVDQKMLLTLDDFEALRTCMVEYDGLAFYNGGREAGASQAHKHLQIVPLPLALTGPAIPLEPLLNGAPGEGIGIVPGLPFRHAFVRINFTTRDSVRENAQSMFDLYGELLRQCGVNQPHPAALVRQTAPYCFLATNDWMLVVPRTTEFFEDISLNSLAFAGSLFIKNEQQLARLKIVGPLNALKSVVS